MDPVTLIVMALTAGAAAGVKDVASAVVTDAFANLKALARDALAVRRNGQLVLDEHEADPEVWERPLKRELAEAGAGENADLVAAAENMLKLAQERGWTGPKYAVTIKDSEKIQIGDYGTQNNY
jgi:hypothetical protein